MIHETLILIADSKFSTRIVTLKTLSGGIVDYLFSYNEYKDFSVYNDWFTPKDVKKIIIDNQNITIVLKENLKDE